MPPKKEVIQEGTVYGMARTIREVDSIGSIRYFLCECLNCGNTFEKQLKDLKKTNRPRTCGKCKFRKDAIVVIPGETYYGFKFIKELDYHAGNRRALAISPEGEEVSVNLNSLYKGTLRVETDTRTTHGMNTERFYKIYRGILQRCNNPNSTNYKNYGGRGIRCLWNSFEEFKTDMHDEYLEYIEFNGDISIDRINVNGDYYKENCRWATRNIQVNNKTNNIKIPKKYGDINLLDLCSKYGIDRQMLYLRLKRGYSFDEALTHEKGKWLKRIDNF